MLTPNYHLPPRVRIAVEGADRLPNEPVIYAMNHTDRYNYWPWQYWLWRNEKRFTATWVKGKYYENKYVGRFMELTNNIPAPSLGYVLTKDFALTVGRAPNSDEYRAVRNLCEGKGAPSTDVPTELLERPRSVLGVDFDPARETYAECVSRLMDAMSARFVELNAECFELGLDLLIFPQGTRSIRLSRGRIGLAQCALRFKRPIVPIGCSGSDKAYPGGSPWARGASITYRVGEPLPHSELEQFHLPDAVDPFGAEQDPAHRNKMQAMTDLVMERINDLVDPPYQFDGKHVDSDGVAGADRFL